METINTWSFSDYEDLRESHTKAGTLIEATYKDEEDGFEETMYIIRYQGTKTTDLFFRTDKAFRNAIDAHKDAGTLVSIFHDEQGGSIEIVDKTSQEASEELTALDKCIDKLRERKDMVLGSSLKARRVLAYRPGLNLPFVVWWFDAEGNTYNGRYYHKEEEAQEYFHHQLRYHNA